MNIKIEAYASIRSLTDELELEFCVGREGNCDSPGGVISRRHENLING